MRTIVSRGLELKGNFETQILLLDRLDVNVSDGTWLRGHRAQLDAVDQWLFERNLLDARVVESINVVPVYSTLS